MGKKIREKNTKLVIRWNDLHSVENQFYGIDAYDLPLFYLEEHLRSSMIVSLKVEEKVPTAKF